MSRRYRHRLRISGIDDVTRFNEWLLKFLTLSSTSTVIIFLCPSQVKRSIFIINIFNNRPDIHYIIHCSFRFLPFRGTDDSLLLDMGRLGRTFFSAQWPQLDKNTGAFFNLGKIAKPDLCGAWQHEDQHEQYPHGILSCLFPAQGLWSKWRADFAVNSI